MIETIGIDAVNDKGMTVNAAFGRVGNGMACLKLGVDESDPFFVGVIPCVPSLTGSPSLDTHKLCTGVVAHLQETVLLLEDIAATAAAAPEVHQARL